MEAQTVKHDLHSGETIANVEHSLLTSIEIVEGSSPSLLPAGMKGGSVQNPIHALASFISDLHAPNGSVAVEGFYE